MAKKTRTIVHVIDESCEMAGVYLDGKLVMLGNYWDFHPGCHGIHKWGNFDSDDDLVARIKAKLTKNGDTVTVTVRKDLSWESWDSTI